MESRPALSSEFVWRRLHSFVGLWLVLFLLFHLFTNSQAALFFGDDGTGFIHEVTKIHNLPYLPLIELFLLGVPFLIHMAWGVRYLRTSKVNSMSSDGSTPSLSQYGRNRAYTWQRITSWILLVGVIAHVIQMRFVERPEGVFFGRESVYLAQLTPDPGLATLADRLGVQLVSSGQKVLQQDISTPIHNLEKIPVGKAVASQRMKQEQLLEERVRELEKRGRVVAVAPDFATAILLVVRDTFKSPWMIALYTIFVLSAAYHAFNGLWTFMITWGVTVNDRSQKRMLTFCKGLMLFVALLGLVTIWGTYWVNLRY